MIERSGLERRISKDGDRCRGLGDDQRARHLDETGEAWIFEDRRDGPRADVKPAEGCTGVAASWCPIHGACSCRSSAHLDDDRCPLHGPTSSHAE